MNIFKKTLKNVLHISNNISGFFGKIRTAFLLEKHENNYPTITAFKSRVELLNAVTHHYWDGVAIEILEDKKILVRTGPTRWSYAAEIPISIKNPSQNSALVIEIQVIVKRGSIGVGVLAEGSSEFISEVEFRQDDAYKTKSIEIIPFDGDGMLIVRNTSDSGEPSIVEINYVEIFIKNYESISSVKKNQIKSALPNVLLKKIYHLDIYQLFITARSGSMAMHAYLDSHPEVILLPQIFKYYDFYLRYIDGLADEKSTFTYAMEFISAYPELFGEKLSVEVPFLTSVDRADFIAAFDRCVEVLGKSGRAIFISIHIAYAWCLRVNLNGIKAIVQHLHHGDWLFPQYLINYYNISKEKRDLNLSAILDGEYIITVRDPVTATSSFFATANKAYQDPLKALEYFDELFELMIQDWLRTSIISKSNTSHFIIRLEDLKKDTNLAICCLADWMKIDSSSNALRRMTVMGHDWGGDSYSPRSNSLRPEPSTENVSLATRQYLYALIGDLLVPFGYGSEVHGCGTPFLRQAIKSFEAEGLTHNRLDKKIRFGEEFLILRASVKIS
jgi:hypothetical protein